MIRLRAGEVLLLDGPCADRVVHYSHPLPEVLVVADRTPAGIRYHDYQQTVRAGEYLHDGRCPCYNELCPVQLDIAT